MTAIAVDARARTHRRVPYILPLEAALEPAAVGGKALNLGRMIRLGARVPPGFVVTTAAFDALLDTDGLRSRIGAFCGALDPHDGGAMRIASAEVCALVAEAQVPAPVLEPVLACGAELLRAASTVIVRSSAVGEDSAALSFAGQLDSVLDVQSVDALERALIACWASYWSERALFYRLIHGVEPRGMGIVVQEQVAARASGVLFTGATRGENALLVEYTGGLADGLVSGRMNPGRFTIDRVSFAVRRGARPERDVAAGESDLFAARQIRDLATTVLTFERELGGPQDVEWAMDADGQMHFVQTRPVTAPLGGRFANGHLSRSDEPPAPSVLWSNANIAENFPSPVSPLLYSIAAAGYTHYFRNLARAFGISRRRIGAMKGPLRHIIGVHRARLYYNLTNVHAVLRMAPFGDVLAESFNRFVGAGKVAAPPAGASTWGDSGGRAARALELCVVVGKTAWQYLFLPRRVAAFERTIDGFAARTHPARLAVLSLPELIAAMREFMEIRCHRWTNASLADAAAMVCYGALQRLLARAFPGETEGALHTTLLKALPDLVSGVPAVRLWELSRLVRSDAALHALFETAGAHQLLSRIEADDAYVGFRGELHAFLEEWGFRCSGELMLTAPSYQEDAVPLIDLVRAYATVGGDSPLDAVRRHDADRRSATRRVLAALERRRVWRFVPFLTEAHIVSLALRAAQGAIRFRERARLKQALLYSRCRRIALAIGDQLVRLAHLEARDDVFFLTFDELDALVSGTAMFPTGVSDLLAVRKREHEELSSVAPPDTFFLPEGAYVDRAEPILGCEPSGDGAVGAAELGGVGACGGEVTARAVVLGDVTEARRLVVGDVLVTRQTDPGWGPVFFLIGGLVVERGGMLSHGAIIAREFGLPCVVGVREATRLIPEGRLITVDGDRGRVRIVD